MTALFKFDDAFEAMTGHECFPWQRRLFDEWLSIGKIPSALDVPTGLGKTTVMAIWLLARAGGAALPRRLVYVVDRRVVVDQATEFAGKLRERLEKQESLVPVRRALGLDDRPLPISTLRGRHVDNREWMVDPAAPAIVVGTVDMVGSRLLFGGYGLSRRMRPYAAGLLGCDTLLMLDEAHLSRPFERLLKSIEAGQGPQYAHGTEANTFVGSAVRHKVPPPFRVLPLSATLGLDTARDPFGLNGDDRANGVVRTRLEARKRLMIEDLSSASNLDEVLAQRAWELMQAETTSDRKPPAVAIYCDHRRVAEKVAADLRGRAGKECLQPHVILFVGGRRVHERVKAAEELQEYGLVGDAEGPRGQPVFFVATSAGEVGVDLDADHMVCDLVSWERMVQRLGRVNRRGCGVARVLVLDQGSPETKTVGADPVTRHEAVRALLEALPQDEAGARQAGPGALLNLADDPVLVTRIADATTRVPLYPPLTRPLVDAWAMTSLEGRAERPEIGPWLHGWIEDDEPQTTVVWRRYLPLRFQANGDDLDAVSARDPGAFFAAAPPQTPELLETATSRVAEWLRKRARQHFTRRWQMISLPKTSEESDEEVVGGHSLMAPPSRNYPVAFLLDHANQPLQSLSVTDIGERNTKDLHAILVGKRLVVDARFGGLTEGMLDDNADGKVPTIEDNWGKPEDVSDPHAWTLRVEACSDSEHAADGWQSVLVAPYSQNSEGDAVSWLIVSKRRDAGESEEARAVARKAQRLDEHRRWAGEEAERIGQALHLEANDKAMLISAAHHHDNGKAAPRWQRAFGAKREGGPYAKTTKAPNQHVLNGFRHEFKSVLDAEKNGLDAVDRSDSRFDLALHLIAAHHGNARPAISVEGYDELPPSEAEARALMIATRFARLQREWGPWGLAWWEALLRAADQAASRRLDEEDS